MDDPTARLLALLEQLQTHNPELAERLEPALTAAAAEVPADAIAALLPVADRLVRGFLDSAVKRATRDILSEFLYFVHRGARRALPDRPAASTLDEPVDTVALVPRDRYSPRQWLRVRSAAGTPPEIVTAVEAAQRRNQLTRSVLEPLFRTLLMVDRDAALRWQLDLCGDGPVDPDVARDILRSWWSLDRLPPEATRQTLAWSSDVRVGRHWPQVAAEADRLLRRETLRNWLARSDRGNQLIRHLKLLDPFDDTDRMVRWFQRGMDHTATSVGGLAAQAEAVARAASAAEADWRREAVLQELRTLQTMLPPLMMLADVFLSSPNGALGFAMAMFGFTRARKRSWQAALEQQSRELVRRGFLTDLKRGRKPVESIRRLCFGDLDLVRAAEAELDLLSQDFDSITQREKVVVLLAPTYASFREPQLLAAELGRRYRRLMRVLHEDRLRIVLAHRFDDAAATMQALTELAALLSESRRLLAVHRHLALPADEVVAAEYEFVQRMRETRVAFLRQFLAPPGPAR